MKQKKKNTLYEFLETEGVLESGSIEDIRLSKKKYWAMVRKEWRRQQRKESKGFTILLNKTEYTIISTYVKGKSITGFIKNAALQTAQEKSGMSKEVKGNVRQALFDLYNSIAKMFQEEKTIVKAEVLANLLQTEQVILTLLDQ